MYNQNRQVILCAIVLTRVKNDFPLMNKSYWRLPSAVLEGADACATTFIEFPLVSIHRCSKILVLSVPMCSCFPFDITIRFPEATDQIRVTSCSSPRQLVPDPPASTASWFGNPNRLKQGREWFRSCIFVLGCVGKNSQVKPDEKLTNACGVCSLQ